jgi:hypothetical protein
MLKRHYLWTLFIFTGFVTVILDCSIRICDAAIRNTPVHNNSFHNGSTGACEGCHIMHKSEDDPGEANNNALVKNNAYRLKGSDPSSTCLRCHQSSMSSPIPEQHLISTESAQMGAGLPPKQLTPGGDFGWLKKTYSWGNNEHSAGERHGHNIVAADFNYSSDNTLSYSPGGNFPSSMLSCTSCHDPHGNFRRLSDGSIAAEGVPITGSGSYAVSTDPVQNGAVSVYRMLAGKGYLQSNISGARVFSADPPAAVTPVAYNRAESSVDTRVAYGSGMSEWCGNCHAGIHNDGNPNGRRHPTGNSAKLNAESVTNYNSYIASGNLNGNAASSYTSLVPFEMGTNDYNKLKMTANSTGVDKSGPTLESNVMCLTCHRAHASGWDSMTRWNMQSEFIVYNGRYPGVDNGAPGDVSQGRTSMEVQKAFYDRPARFYAYYQRSLCNKCHAKD